MHDVECDVYASYETQHRRETVLLEVGTNAQPLQNKIEDVKSDGMVVVS